MTNPNNKQLMFQQVRLDTHNADAYASEINATSISPENASELLRRLRKACAAAEAWERVMRGVEMPR